MPELPEVETVKRKLQPIEGEVIDSLWNDWPRSLKSNKNARAISADIAGRKILNISRIGKALLVELGEKNSRSSKTDRTLAFHLRMSGRLYIAKSNEQIPPKELKHIHTIVKFRDKTELRFHDPRKFGITWYGTPDEVRSFPYFSKIGPDALNLSFAEFKNRVFSHKGMMKPLLLRQDLIAGVGNIVADETLWNSKIHPKKRAEELSDAQIKSVYKSLMMVLKRGIKAGGATLRDWKHPDNKNGKFQQYMKVYGRKNESCPRCGAKIKRIVVGSRGTWICTTCQKL